MGWFDHQHYWRQKTGLNTIYKPGEERASSGLIVEDCSCGYVRTIEFAPGADPVIRIAKPPSDEQKVDSDG